MHTLLMFISYAVLFYSFYKIMFWFKRTKMNDQLYGIMEIYFLEHKFKVAVKETKIDKMLNIVALSNSLIFTITIMSTMWIHNIIIRLLIMFVLLIPLIYFVYYGVSIYLKKKGNKNNV